LSTAAAAWAHWPKKRSGIFGDALQGIAIVRLLKQIEHRTQRRIHELFDLVCGTSTGGILAVALALKQMTLEQCEGIYRWVSDFRHILEWKYSLYSVKKSGQQSMDIVVHGCKHKANTSVCSSRREACLSPAMSYSGAPLLQSLAWRSSDTRQGGWQEA